MARYWMAAGAVLLGFGSPAWADHPVPSDAAGGAGLTVASPETLDAGKVSAGVRVTYSRPDQRSDAELATLAGAHIHAHNSDHALSASVGVAYGMTDRLTVSAELPYRLQAGLREGEHSHHGGGATNSVVELGSVGGIGDLTLLAKYRLRDGLAVIGGVKAPTGETDARSDQGARLETEHQPGSGSWDPIAGAAFATDMAGLTLTVSGLYQFSGEGVQDTELGDRASVGVSLSRRFGPPDHHEPGEAADHAHTSWDTFVELAGEWEGRQRIAGEVSRDSGGRVLWLSPGVRFNTAAGVAITAAVSLPLWQAIGRSHPENGYRLTLGVGRAF